MRYLIFAAILLITSCANEETITMPKEDYDAIMESLYDTTRENIIKDFYIEHIENTCGQQI